MEDKFNKLKNGLKLKIALAFVITTIFAALFLILGIKNKNGILYMCFALSYLFIFPILIFLFNIGFDGRKTEIIEKTVNQNLEEPFKFSLYKAIGGKEIEVLLRFMKLLMMIKSLFHIVLNLLGLRKNVMLAR